MSTENPGNRSENYEGGIKDTGGRIKDTRDMMKEKYSAFVENSSEGIWCFEAESPIPLNMPEEKMIGEFFKGRLVECNETYARMMGTDRETIMGKRLSDLMPMSEENLEYLKRFIRSNFRLKNEVSHEIDVNGEDKYFSNSFVGVIENGMLLRAWGTQTDITPFLSMKRELEKARTEWENMFNSIEDSVILLSKDHTIIKANPATERLLGMNRSMIEGRPCYVLFHRTNFPPLNCPHEMLLQTGKPESAQLLIEAANGFFLVSVYPVFNDKGEIERVIHFAKDITELEAARREVEESRKFLDAIVSQSPLGILTTDSERRVTSYNPALLKIFGISSVPEGEKIERIQGLNEPLLVMDIKAVLRKAQSGLQANRNGELIPDGKNGLNANGGVKPIPDGDNALHTDSNARPIPDGDNALHTDSDARPAQGKDNALPENTGADLRATGEIRLKGMKPERYIHYTISALDRGEGEGKGALCMIQDITVEKEIELKRENEMKRLESFLELARRKELENLKLKKMVGELKKELNELLKNEKRPPRGNSH